MRTNIVIDDQLMADVMASGDYKTKKEAVEEGLRLLKRKKAYAALLAARGTLFWDDSDEAWARAQAEQPLAPEAVQEVAAPYTVTPPARSTPRRARSR
ncbi:type II toxin-antitoxin system VapB family antitoxin [Leptothrix discophora]|uniref:Type II toxin-antitoxin system VapB family antitoxin n=1 Tax=Leptothrix discophora TaxID=89 RepID=A0ABT9G1L1_LEPDI|nr:type II toxin-antitoxin system VapB family antitoxin [Leptothrix discophora]MDP4300315.1 type II toxin-antitoxin system VapB family antitoxin [Leptothrix discophora]